MQPKQGNPKLTGRVEKSALPVCLYTTPRTIIRISLTGNRMTVRKAASAFRAAPAARPFYHNEPEPFAIPEGTFLFYRLPSPFIMDPFSVFAYPLPGG